MANRDVAAGSIIALDSTLPPMPVKKLLAAGGGAVYALSQDAALTQALVEAGGDQFPISIVTTFQALRELVGRGECKIVLFDADMLETRGIRNRVVELKALEPSLVVVIAAPRDAAEDLMGLLSERTIHRLLIKPAAVGITRLLLESAVSRYLQVRQELEARVLAPIEVPKRRPRQAPKSAWPAWLLAIALVSLLIGAVVVGGLAPFEFSGSNETGGGARATRDAARPDEIDALLNDAVVGSAVESSKEPQEPLEAELAPVELVPAADAFAARLDRAAAALAEGRIASPDDDNALDLYAAILVEQPDHPDATLGLAAAIDAVFGEAEEALLAGEYHAAERALADVERVQPESSRLHFLETQLHRERELGAAVATTTMATIVDTAPEPREIAAESPSPSTAPAVESAEPSELASLIAIAWTRVRQDQLLAPRGDSARDYVDRAVALAPTDPEVLALREQVALAMAESALLTLAAGDIAGATERAEHAARLGAPSDTLAALDVDLATAREAAVRGRQAEIFALGMRRMDENRLVTPERDSALFHLTRLRDENPRYPGLDSALRDLSGLIVERAEALIAAADWSAAEPMLASLTRIADDGTVQRLRTALESARLQAEYLTTPAAAGELRIISASGVNYPENAQRRNIEGWVDAEFVVGLDGVPHDARVVGAEPVGQFEEAALAAISLYRYEPFEHDGRTYERLTRLRIRFDLE